MSDYISREKAAETIQYIVCRGRGNKDLICKRGSCADCGIIDIMNEMLCIESADVQPVRRGCWELTGNPSFRKCSECGAWWSSDITDNCFTKYCPKCGARMDGDTE